jgi:membrane fusion protein (multidrug efflux system)
MIIMIGCVLLLVAVLALGKFLQIRALIASVPKPGPQTVSTVEVQKLQWQSQFTAVGTLNPVRGADLSTEVAGLVRKVHFKSGQDVKAGALLVELNADSDIALLHSAEAAAAQAATVLKRDQAQLAIQAVSQAQIDADINDLKAKRAQVEQQAAVVAKKSIRAPFAGRLGISGLNPGQYVNAGDKLVTLQTLDPIYVDFSLPQQQLAGLEVGQVVNLAVDTFPGQAFSGKINAISPKVDSATRNVQVEATMANPKQVLLPGMFANVKIDIGGAQERLTLPSTAVTYNPYGSTVYVVKQAEAPKPGAAPATPGAPAPCPGHRRARQAAARRPADLRGDRPHARRPDRHRQGPGSRPGGGQQRPEQAEERHAGHGGQHRAADQRREPEAAGKVRLPA